MVWPRRVLLQMVFLVLPLFMENKYNVIPNSDIWFNSLVAEEFKGFDCVLECKSAALFPIISDGGSRISTNVLFLCLDLLRSRKCRHVDRCTVTQILRGELFIMFQLLLRHNKITRSDLPLRVPPIRQTIPLRPLQKYLRLLEL